MPTTWLRSLGASSTPNQPTAVKSPNSSCVFATGSGTYTSSLCFVDFSSWNSYTGAYSRDVSRRGPAHVRRHHWHLATR